MAFSLRTFQNLSGSGDAPKIWTYSTADTLATVMGSGYFNNVSGMVAAGDLILAVISDGPPVTLSVSAISSGVVTVSGGALNTPAGTGITTGTGTVCKSSVARSGAFFKTEIFIDLTGLNSMNTDGDIIGVNDTALVCHIGRITAAECGTIFHGRMTCLELPAGGDPNIALYSATEGTGVENGAIGSLTETALFDPAADWAHGNSFGLTAYPAANEYLYLVQGDATGTDGTYTAGKFLIELWGA